jgi:SAM-dependent methyltransferase
MRDFDEGLGTVYERIIMNDMFDRYIDKYNIHSVLEAPVFGMTGLTGINSVEFAKKGCSLTIVDNNPTRINESKKLWKLIGREKNVEFCYYPNFSYLNFKSNSFDFVWNFAALWHIQDAPTVIKEMTRVSSNLIFISVQNNKQVGYYLRKHFIDKKLFSEVYEDWLNLNLVKSLLLENGATIIEQGVFDMPPFPDIAMPVGELLQRIGIKRVQKEKARDKKQEHWQWNIMNYYMGKDPQFKDRINRFRFIENSHLPVGFKTLWSHHRYILAQKGST